jgi:hypothetical protein
MGLVGQALRLPILRQPKRLPYNHHELALE